MSYCAGRTVLANGSSRTPSARRNSSLEEIYFVARAFKKGMAEKDNRRLAIGCSARLDSSSGAMAFRLMGIDRILVVAVWETGGQV